MSDNGRSWHKQEKVIQELIRPTNLSLSEIAERVGVGERTLYRWMSDSHFKEELSKARRKVREESIETLKVLFSRAVNNLSQLLDDSDTRIRIRACQLVLDFNLEIIEFAELDERLKKLEDARDGITPLNSQEKFAELMEKINTHLGIIPNG